MFNPRANWKRLNWELHSVVGIWTFALVFMWAVTGVYVVFPTPFQKAINHYFPLREYSLDPVAAQAAPEKGVAKSGAGGGHGQDVHAAPVSPELQHRR